MSRARLVPALAAVVLAGLLAALTGCGDEVRREVSSPPKAAPAERPTDVPAAGGRVTTTYPVTVLDDGDGAELCLGGVMDSLPPQCGGPSLVGWDWADHEGDFEKASGVRWGDFVVTGTFDGGSVTASEVVPTDEFEEPEARPDLSFETPCPEPEGGWVPVDPATTTQETFNAAMVLANGLDGFVDASVDQSINPAFDDQDDTSLEHLGKMNDPKLEVLTVRVTHDAEAVEKQLHAVYGGALCVTTAEHSAAEIEAVQQHLVDLPGMLMTGSEDNRAGVTVVYDDGSYQAWADATYGEGLVLVSSALQDVED